MKSAVWILIAIALLPAAGWAQALPNNPEPARSGAADWNRVEGLANGQPITVARQGEPSVRCQFTGATSDSLFCDSFYRQTQYRFDRADVERVRSNDKRKNLTIMIGSLMAAGFIWGVATPPEKGTPRLVTGFAGAAAGALVGTVVAVPAALLIPGRLIYRQHAKQRSSAPTATTQSTPLKPYFEESESSSVKSSQEME
jgi:hypothetical protein